MRKADNNVAKKGRTNFEERICIISAPRECRHVGRWAPALHWLRERNPTFQRADPGSEQPSLTLFLCWCALVDRDCAPHSPGVGRSDRERLETPTPFTSLTHSKPRGDLWGHRNTLHNAPQRERHPVLRCTTYDRASRSTPWVPTSLGTQPS